jgi:hypothetical protein
MKPVKMNHKTPFHDFLTRFEKPPQKHREAAIFSVKWKGENRLSPQFGNSRLNA